MRKSIGMMAAAAALATMMIAATGCTTPPEQIARNVIATGSGAIASAQGDYSQECIANPAGQVCGIVNRTVDAQNAAITALESYCGYQLTSTLPDPAIKCVPVKSALGGLNVAITNLNQLITELKGASRIKSQKRDQPPAEPEPFNAGLAPEGIAIALLALKGLLAQLLKGQPGEYASDAIDAAQNAITELESVQGTDVTLGQLESLRLHKLWPDVPKATDQGAAGPAGSGTAAGDAIAGK